MRKTAILLLSVVFVISFLNPGYAAGLHNDWKSAKKTASSELKKADLKELSKYVKFNKNLGPNLDKLEKISAKSPGKLSLKTILDDKKLSSAFTKFSKKILIEENWLYLTKGHKLKPEKAFSEYIKPGSKYELNIDSKEKEEWMKCSKSGDWKPCNAMLKTTYKSIFALTNSDSLGKFQKWLKENPKENPYYQDPEPLKKEILATCKDYSAQVKKMDKKAGKAKEGLLKAINEIEREVNKM